ncbi:hypothetical protein ACFL3X_01825, partial [Gemmatimonadota bacterium]
SILAMPIAPEKKWCPKVLIPSPYDSYPKRSLFDILWEMNLIKPGFSKKTAMAMSVSGGSSDHGYHAIDLVINGQPGAIEGLPLFAPSTTGTVGYGSNNAAGNYAYWDAVDGSMSISYSHLMSISNPIRNFLSSYGIMGFVGNTGEGIDGRADGGFHIHAVTRHVPFQPKNQSPVEAFWPWVILLPGYSP